MSIDDDKVMKQLKESWTKIQEEELNPQFMSDIEVLRKVITIMKKNQQALTVYKKARGDIQKQMASRAMDEAANEKSQFIDWIKDNKPNLYGEPLKYTLKTGKIDRDLLSTTESVGDDVYDASSLDGATSFGGKVSGWIDKVMDKIFSDGQRQKGALKYNAKIIRAALTKKYGEEKAQQIEQTYKQAVLNAMDELGISEYVREDLKSGNFGDLIFRDEIFNSEKMAQVEDMVKQKLNEL